MVRVYLGKGIQSFWCLYLWGKLVKTRYCCNMINTKYLLCKNNCFQTLGFYEEHYYTLKNKNIFFKQWINSGNILFLIFLEIAFMTFYFSLVSESPIAISNNRIMHMFTTRWDRTQPPNQFKMVSRMETSRQFLHSWIRTCSWHQKYLKQF